MGCRPPGWNWTVKVHCPPLSPTTLLEQLSAGFEKPAPETVTVGLERLAVPLLVTANCFVSVVPTLRSPKSNGERLTDTTEAVPVPVRLASR